MKKLFKAVLLLLVIFLFFGCEAGLVSDDGSSNSSGEKFSFSEMYHKINELQKLIPPIGSIQAWHKSKAGTPELLEGWVECNGRLISDPDSVYDGTNAPDLNSMGRFLRGGIASGTLQEEATAVNGLSMSTNGAHTHNVYYHNDWDKNVGGSDSGDGVWSEVQTIQSGSAGDHDHDLDGDDETRPVNMSVVWIMRIK
ncbi:MAG: hypothetical protein GY754_11940 [bacterium]|nr:hypothetical protein [bacterium]